MILKIRSWLAIGLKDGVFCLAGGPILEQEGAAPTTKEQGEALALEHFDSILEFRFGQYTLAADIGPEFVGIRTSFLQGETCRESPGG